MSKVIKTVLIIAVAVAVVVFAPQIAILLQSVAGAIGVSATIASAVASAFTMAALVAGLSAFTSLFRKAPNISQAMGDRLSTSCVPTAPRKIVFGTTSGGQDVRFFESEFDLPSSKKDGWVQAIALASHKISAFKSFYVDDELVWQNGSWIARRDGFAATNPLRIVLEGTPSNGFPLGSGRFWNSTCTFTGCAYYAPTWKMDFEDVWKSGIPTRLTAIIDGCPVYDPRRDSTVGGSGPHRINNQATWAFRDGSVEIGRNPALALITYLIGWRINGKLAWGMGIPASRINFENFKVYANVAEERVALQAGGTTQRYTADAIYSTADSHETVLSSLSAAMGSCKLTDVGGLYCLIGGYDDTTGPRVTFTEDDLLAPVGAASPFVFSPAPPARETYNIVRGRFADPEALYQLTDWGTPIEIEPLADGIPRTMALDLGAVSRAETCQRIAKQMLLREALCPGVFTAVFGPRAFAVQVGDLVNLSIRSQGWNNKLFRVMEQAETHDMFFQMTLREESAAVYSWDREEKPLPAKVRPQGYDPKMTIAPEGLALTSESFQGANNVSISRINVGWTPELSGRVMGIQIQSRALGTASWSEQAGLFDARAGVFSFTSNAPGIDVEVRARYRMTSAVYSDWTLGSVATAAVETIDNSARDEASGAKGQATEAAGKATEAKGVADVAKDAITDANGNVIRSEDLKTDLAAIQITAIPALDGRVGDAVEALENEIERATLSEDAIRLRTVDLEARPIGVGNLLQNTEFVNDPVDTRIVHGWIHSGNTTGAVNLAGAPWQLVGENNISFYEAGTVAQYSTWASSRVSVRAGRTYQAYAYGASHRSTIELIVYWYDVNDVLIGHQITGYTPQTRIDLGGRALDNWDQIGFKNIIAPSNAFSAKIDLRKYPTLNGFQDSYAWFVRPFFGPVSVGSTNWIEFQHGSNRVAQAVSLSKIVETNTAFADADGALSNRVTKFETKFGENFSTYDQTITTLTNANTSTANRSTALEARSGKAGGAINLNPDFQDYRSSTGFPFAWGSDSPQPSLASRVAGEAGVGYAMRMTAGASQDSYTAQTTPHGSISTNGFYVIEADFRLNSGNLYGSGVLFRVSINGAGIQDHVINFFGEIGGGEVGRTYRLRKMFQPTIANASYTNLYAMSQWSALGSVSVAKDLTWYRLAVRPASEQEILARQVNDDVNRAGTGLVARIGTVETATTDGRFAGAQRVSTLEAKTVATPRTYRLRAAGLTGISAFGGSAGCGLYNHDLSVKAIDGANRSYTVVQFNPDNSPKAVAAFDVYEGAAEAMAAYLNGIGGGQSVVIWTYDEPSNHNNNPALITAMRACGAGEIFGRLAYRSAYILIGKTGSGTGTGQEFYNDSAAWLDIYFDVLNGLAIIRNDSSTGIQLGARVQTTELAIADIDGKTQAHLLQSVVAGTQTARVSMYAESSPDVQASKIELVANEITIGVQKTLEIVANRVRVNGDLSVSSKIMVNGDKRISIQYKPFVELAGDGATIAYPDFGYLPTFSISSAGLAALNAGETYQLQMSSITNTSAVASLKISVPGAPANYAISSDYAGSSGPTRQIDKTQPDSSSNSYRMFGSVILSAYSQGSNNGGGYQNELTFGQGEAYYTGEIKLWALTGAGWQQVRSTAINDVRYYNNAGMYQELYTFDETFSANLGVTKFGMTCEGGLTHDIEQVSWSAQGSGGGVRSATPSGQRASITVQF